MSKPTPLSDAIHLGNTDIESECWEPPTVPPERPALPGQEHLIDAGWPALPAVIGYRKNGTPIHETPQGALTTRAFVLCSACHITIKTSGGPINGALCMNCFKGQNPAP